MLLLGVILGADNGVLFFDSFYCCLQHGGLVLDLAVETLTKDQAIEFVGGKRDEIHCFLNPGGMLLGADWSWDAFEKILDDADSIQKSGEQATRMRHPLAVLANNKWHFFESKGH